MPFMQSSSKPLIVGIAWLAAVALPLSSHAATVAWGTIQTLTGSANIVSTGVTGLAGANFGITTGTTTIVNNGSVDIEFKSLRSGQSATLSNGVTVAADSQWVNWGPAAGNSAIAGNFGVVLDSNLGIETGAPVSTSATITLTGLNIGTQYRIQFFADSTGNNSQTISGSAAMNTLSGQFVTGTFTADAVSQVLPVTRSTDFAVANALTIGVVAGGGDTTPPAWIATWPQAAPLSTTSVTVGAKINEVGTAYYVVLPDGSTPPTAPQVKAGTNSSNTPVSASGSLGLIANTEVTAPIAGLSPGTAYDIWFVAQDAAGSPNLQASPTKVDATTLAPDTTPPAWIATWPQVAPLSATSLTVRAKINEAGTAYYVVLANGAAAPSAVQVKAGNGSTNSPALKSGSIPLSTNAEAVAPVTGLLTDSTYDVYSVAEDAVPNLQAVPSVVSVSLTSLAAEPLISELVAVGSTLKDEDLAAQDWIEIHNPNGTPIDLAGYFLTDDAVVLTKWTFPSTTLAAGGYLVVFSSDKNRAVSGSPLHTNFKLSANGEYLALVKPDGTTVVSGFSPNFPGQIGGFSYGLNSTATNGYFAPPTPGAANGPLVPPLAAPILSPACASFTTSTSVTITEGIPGVGNVIRYTTNGSEPTTSSTLYPGSAIPISGTTHLRARVFSSSGAPGAITGGLYQQLATTSNLAGIDSPSSFNSELPILVVENFGAGAIPAVDSPTLQTARLSVYDPAVGNSILSGNPDACFRIGIKRRGNSSRDWAKGQYRFELRDETGADLDAGLLGLPAESDWTLNGPYPDKSLIRDSLVYDLGRQLGMEAPRTRHFELFCNLDGGDLRSSDYMGVYVLIEKIKQGKNRTDITEMTDTDNTPPAVTGGYIMHFDEPFHITEGGGPKPTNWRSLEIDEPKNPTTAQKIYIGKYMDDFVATLGWSRWGGANNAGVVNNDPITGYPAYINVDSFVNLLTINELTRNQDSYVGSDYMYKDRAGKLHKGPLWDFNLTMGVGCCHNNTSTRYGWMLDLKFCRGGDEHSYEPDFLVPLLRDADFRQQWIDRWFKLRRYGVLEDDALNARIDSHAAPLTAAAARNFVKWPILGSSVPVAPFNSPVSTTWAAQIDFMKDWLGERMLWIDAQFPKLVTFSPSPRAVTAGTPVTLTASGGTIYYTTDGSDPRLAGGGISAAAVAISNGGTAMVNATTTLIARTYHNTWTTTPSGATWGATWGAPTQVTYVLGTPANASNLLVTEVNYHPASPMTAEELADPNFRNDDFEFIEVKNISGGPIDLSGMAFIAGITYFVPPTQVLAAGECGVFVESLAAFRARYGHTPRVLGVYSDKLDNGGESVRLVDISGATIRSFTFSDTWFPTTDGGGDTLAAINQTTPGADLSNPLSWDASDHPLGTPGMPNNSLNFAGWRRENFTAMELADPLIGGALADLDGDGIATLMEFALGLDPNLHDAPAVLPTAGTVNLAGDDYMTMSFRRLKLGCDVTYRAMVSPDLRDWTEMTMAVGTPVDNSDGTETVIMRDLLKTKDAARRFMRLEVER